MFEMSTEANAQNQNRLQTFNLCIFKTFRKRKNSKDL